MTDKRDTANLLQFVDESPPRSLAETAGRIVSLIDERLACESPRPSPEHQSVLGGLRQDLATVEFSSEIDPHRPHFVLTPQELNWLDRHEQNDWLDYLISRYKMKIYPVQKKLTAFPPHLLIEPTSVCNIRCVMCFQVDEAFSRNRDFLGYMDWSLFTSLVDQAKDHGCHAITLASRGEPTLHKKFGEMLAHLKEKRILDAKINTNATLLTEQLAHQILAADIPTVTFSVDASTKETYERIRVGGEFERVLANIERFNELRLVNYPNSCTTTRISGVAVERTQEPAEMRRFWSDYVDEVTIVRQIPRWGSYENQPFGRDSACHLLHERMYVWYDGVCNPCDFDYKSYLSPGRVDDRSVSEIWLGSAFQQLRQRHATGRRSSIVPCDRCPF